MRNLLFSIAILSICLTANAEHILDLRHRKEIVKDTASMEIVYAHIAIDPVKNERRVKYEMLTIGNNFNKYGGYDNYQIDSLYMENPEFDPPFEEYRELSRNYETISESTLTNKTEGTITFHGKEFINYYRYTEPLPAIEWELSDESDEIIGYKCRKATAKWRGHDWTAWYSDIPEDAGPWKFQGLPGLILKLEDSTGEHFFEAIGTKNDVFPFGYGKKLYCKTTREKFNNLYKEYCQNSGAMLVDSGMVIPRSEEEELMLRSKKLFFAPIELE